MAALAKRVAYEAQAMVKYNLGINVLPASSNDSKRRDIFKRL